MGEGLTTKRRVRGNPLQYSCLENAWTEEPGWLVYRVTVRHTEATWHSTADHEGRA